MFALTGRLRVVRIVMSVHKRDGNGADYGDIEDTFWQIVVERLQDQLRADKRQECQDNDLGFLMSGDEASDLTYEQEANDSGYRENDGCTEEQVSHIGNGDDCIN